MNANGHGFCITLLVQTLFEMYAEYHFLSQWGTCPSPPPIKKPKLRLKNVQKLPVINVKWERVQDSWEKIFSKFRFGNNCKGLHNIKFVSTKFKLYFLAKKYTINLKSCSPNLLTCMLKFIGIFSLHRI